MQNCSSAGRLYRVERDDVAVGIAVGSTTQVQLSGNRTRVYLRSKSRIECVGSSFSVLSFDVPSSLKSGAKCTVDNAYFLYHSAGGSTDYYKFAEGWAKLSRDTAAYAKYRISLRFTRKTRLGGPTFKYGTTIVGTIRVDKDGQALEGIRNSLSLFPYHIALYLQKEAITEQQAEEFRSLVPE